jgi:small subunit ribosomal protein S15
MCYTIHYLKSQNMLTTRKKLNAIKPVQLHDKDTGSAEAQIAILTRRIVELTGHLKTHKKDNHSRRGLIQMVADRRAHLKYLQNNHKARYTAVAKELGLK